MGRNIRRSATAVAIATAAMGAFVSVSAADTPKMGGGYKDVIAIPVDDPQTKQIAGALFKPTGAGPFPAVIYMSTCAGIDSLEDRFVQNALRDRLVSKGFAVLILDSYWPRQEWRGVCDKAKDGGEYDARGAKDIHAAIGVLRANPEIDANRIFIQGYALGASAALSAIDASSAATHKTKVAGAIAVSPHCRGEAALSAPALIMVGDKDNWTPAAPCKALERPPHVKVVVYPGVGHAFVLPFGHRVSYDHKAASDARDRADAFLDAHSSLR